MVVQSSQKLEEIRAFLKEILVSGKFDEYTLYTIEECLFDEEIDVRELKKYVEFLPHICIEDIKFWLANGLDLNRFLQEFGTDAPRDLMYFVAKGLLKGISWEQVKKLAQIYVKNSAQKKYGCISLAGKIYQGVKQELTEEEIGFYNDHIFRFENGHTREEASSFTRSGLPYPEMWRTEKNLLEKTFNERPEFYNDREVLSFLLELRQSGKFNEEEWRQIELGLRKGLTLQQVKIYANSKLDEYQMREIRLGLQNGLSMEQVKFYAKPSFDHAQMREIRLGLEHGLSLEEVKFYAKKKFEHYLMRSIRICLERKVPLKQIKHYMKKFKITDWVNQARLCEILAGLSNGLTQEQIEFYAKPELDPDMMREIRLGFKNGLTQDQIEVYAKPEFKSSQAREIRYSFLYGLTKEQIALFARPDFDTSIMRLIRNALLKGFSIPEIEIAIKYALKRSNMVIDRTFENSLKSILSDRKETLKLLALEQLVNKLKERFESKRLLENNKRKISL